MSALTYKKIADRDRAPLRAPLAAILDIADSALVQTVPFALTLASFK